MVSFRKILAGFSLVLPMALSIPGCGGSGDSLPREALSGTVTLDDKPLESGSITFTPNDPSAPPTVADAPIQGGSFSISASQGLAPGAYRVRISSPQPGADPKQAKRPKSKSYDSVSGTGADDAPEEAPSHESIRARYNSQSKLDAEVKKGGPNTLEFPLTSK